MDSNCAAWQFDKVRRFQHAMAVKIELTKDVEDFLEEQVRMGVCTDPSELVNDVLRSVRAQQNKPFETSPELEKWLLEAADSLVTPLTDADFAGIRARVLARRKPPSA